MVFVKYGDEKLPICYHNWDDEDARYYYSLCLHYKNIGLNGNEAQLILGNF